MDGEDRERKGTAREWRRMGKTGTVAWWEDGWPKTGNSSDLRQRPHGHSFTERINNEAQVK